MMRVFSIQSGSCGNCYFYESNGIRLIFDAGISWRTAADRMSLYGIPAENFHGLFISHDHSDHTSCAGVFQRKMKYPLFCTRGSHRVMEHRLGKIDPEFIEYFRAEDTVTVGHVKVHCIATPHDAAEPCAFIIDDGEWQVGILTDLGHCFPSLREAISTLDVVFLESNFDNKMLEENPYYPDRLKSRIRGKRGHLENMEAAQLVRSHSDDKLLHVLLSHLSQDNNSPEVALNTHREILKYRSDLKISVAPRDTVSPLIHCGILKKNRRNNKGIQLSFAF